MANPGPSTQVTDNTQSIGSANSAVGFYGVTPVARRSNPAQGAIPTSLGTFSIFAINSVALSPASVAANTCAAQTLTFTGSPNIAGDFVGTVNKPSAQAGLGLAGFRQGASGAYTANYINVTGGAIVPTASESYLVLSVRGFIPTFTASPAPVAAKSTSEQFFSVPGIALGNPASVVKPTDQAGLGICNVRVAADNVLAVTFINSTASAITPTANEVYSYFSAGGYDALSNDFVMGINVGTLGSVGATTTAELTVSAPGMLTANDFIVGVSKPTAQAGLAVCTARVSATDTLAVTFVNPTVGGITPTANEVYTIQAYKPLRPPSTVFYDAVFAPTSVAANTSAEQTFTVTGIPASSMVLVNKPTHQQGLGIGNVRVSGSNTIAITYVNVSSAAIVPNTESYEVLSIPFVPSAGNFVCEPLALGSVIELSLVNEMRTSLVNLGLINGS